MTGYSDFRVCSHSTKHHVRTLHRVPLILIKHVSFAPLESILLIHSVMIGWSWQHMTFPRFPYHDLWGYTLLPQVLALGSFMSSNQVCYNFSINCSWRLRLAPSINLNIEYFVFWLHNINGRRVLILIEFFLLGLENYDFTGL